MTEMLNESTMNVKKKRAKAGQLKIFFGYATGVGKTYAMLNAARDAKRRNIDVVIGYVDTHTGITTRALTEGFEVLSPLLDKTPEGTKAELNLDAAIARRPDLIIVDELAHTNSSVCRHEKRYKDIEELLTSGIDVYTTVNIQNIESLTDAIVSITGNSVQERIPDTVFDNADQVELVDIEPDELIERLNTGKIYKDAQIQNSLRNFFDPKRLTMLREMSLRRCADRITRRLEILKNSQKAGDDGNENILVCLSSSPTNPKIIRTAARMANAFQGTFTALYVESPDTHLNEEDRKRLRSNTRLAQQLGACVETVSGRDIPFQIAEFARLTKATKVVMGRSAAQRKWFWKKATLTERLLAYAPNLDIYIIPDRIPLGGYHERHQKRPRGRLNGYDLLKSFLLLSAATGIGFLFRFLGFSEANIIMVYILGVLLTAIITTQSIYSIASSVVSVLLFNYFFTDPYFTFKATDSDYPMTFLIMFLAAFIASRLAVRMKNQTRQASESAYRTKILLETNQLIQEGTTRAEIVSIAAKQLVKLLQRDVIIYMVENDGLCAPQVFTHNGDDMSEEYLTQNEKAVAIWAWKNNKHAGATTETLRNSKCMYLAIRAKDTVYGVAGIAMPGEPLDTFENNVMLSIFGECALALEKEAALREREQSALIAKNEQLRANLLRSISHDLRTPLTSISGNAGILLANSEDMDEQSRKRLYKDIYEDSLWLINLVENLLSVTRIENGTMKLRMNTELIEEVISEALHHIGRRAENHKISVESSDEFIFANMDAHLIMQVIINIVDNAIKYTPPGSEIAINTFVKNHFIVVEISDNGSGIPDESKAHIFDMFYTAGNRVADGRRSLGLGLALCKSIIIAHGGEISVRDNYPKGTVFSFTLPQKEVTLHE